MDTQDEQSTPFKPVLIDTGGKRGSQQKRAAVKNKDKSNSRVSVTGLNKRIEALFILIADTREGAGALLTREELDINPRTKDLHGTEKNALVKYWPKFQENLETAREIKKLREEETALVLKAEKKGTALRKREGLDDLPIADQLHHVARIFHNQVFKSLSSVAATDVEDIHSDPLSKELYKLRVQYAKDAIWFARNLVDLGDRIRATDNASIADGVMSDETKQMLNDADALLIRRGVPTFIEVN